MRESQSSKLNLRYYLTKAHLAVPFYGRRETTQTDGFELEKCKDDWCFEWAGAPRTLISSQLVTFSDRKQQHSQFDLNNVNILEIGRKKVFKSQSWPSYWLIYCVIGSRSAVEIRRVSLFCSRCCWIITVLRNLIYFCADTFECKYTSFSTAHKRGDEAMMQDAHIYFLFHMKSTQFVYSIQYRE